jgi:hypothetical protein
MLSQYLMQPAQFLTSWPLGHSLARVHYLHMLAQHFLRFLVGRAPHLQCRRLVICLPSEPDRMHVRHLLKPAHFLSTPPPLDACRRYYTDASWVPRKLEVSVELPQVAGGGGGSQRHTRGVSVVQRSGAAGLSVECHQGHYIQGVCGVQRGRMESCCGRTSRSSTLCRTTPGYATPLHVCCIDIVLLHCSL